MILNGQTDSEFQGISILVGTKDIGNITRYHHWNGNCYIGIQGRFVAIYKNNVAVYMACMYIKLSIQQRCPAIQMPTEEELLNTSYNSLVKKVRHLGRSEESVQ